MEKHLCSIIASSPSNFPWGFDEEDEACAALKLIMLHQITSLQSEGVNDFAVVLDAGAGLYAAELINGLREQALSLSLICVIPWEEQAAKWTPELRDRYYNEQANCSEVIPATVERSPVSEVAAMLTAIDMSDTVLAIADADDVNTAVALHYAEKIDRTILCINPKEIKYRF